MISPTTEVPRTAAVLEIPTNLRGSLDSFYAEYIAAPENQERKEKLFEAISDYAARSVHKITKDRRLTDSVSKSRIESDVSQTVCLKVFQKLDKFKGDSSFSTWVYQIAKNELFNESDRIKQRNEVQLLDVLAQDAPNAGYQVSAAGEGPDGNSVDNADHGSNGRAKVLSGAYLHENEAGINANLDFEKVFRKLSRRDQQIVDLYQEGYKSPHIAAEFGRDAKWASNQLDRLKELLKHEMYVAETILHSCRRSIQPKSLSEGDFCVEDAGSYFALPLCRCRKRLTGLEAKTLAKTGEAQLIYKIKDGQPVLIKKEVWAPQAVRVPRCGLRASSEAGIERAFVDNQVHAQLDLEIGHEMSQKELRKLIVPFRPDQWQGRPRFTDFTEARTKGGFEAKTEAKVASGRHIPTKVQAQTSKLPRPAVKALDGTDYAFLFGLDHQAFRVSLLANLKARMGVSAP
ncbi:MAG: sigma-70 family RNA polymerase sigma factor [Candidatus Acidiferrum sp.]